MDARIGDLMITVDRRIGHAVHDAQSAFQVAARQSFQIIVAYRLIAVDDADSGGIGDAVAQKHVAFDQIAVAVAQHERPLRRQHQILAQHIGARFDRDDLDLAIGPLEDIALDDRRTVAQRFVTRADTDGLAAIGTQRRTMAEIIMVDARAIGAGLALGPDHRQRDTGIGLAFEMRMVDAVVGAIDRHPIVLRAAIGLVEPVDHHLGHATVARIIAGGAAKRDHVAGRAVPVAEYQSRHDQMAARQSQVRLTRQDDAAPGLCGKRDRLVGGAPAREHDAEIAPYAIGEDDRIACTGLFNRLSELRLIGHAVSLLGVGHGWYGDRRQHHGKRRIAHPAHPLIAGHLPVRWIG